MNKMMNMLVLRCDSCWSWKLKESRTRWTVYRTWSLSSMKAMKTVVTRVNTLN